MASAQEKTAGLGAALDVLEDQPRVRDLLASAVREGRLSHAYLFVGAPGAGMQEAAEALAKCVVCPNGGDGSCDECRRVAHRTHPDVHWLEPDGVSGYLFEQVSDLLSDVALTPQRAKGKVYIVDRAELLRGASANALLKTIEEPPEGVVFILIGRSVPAMLPTIVSRCQVVPFRTIPADVALESVVRSTGCNTRDARIALAVAGTPARACDFLSSAPRRETRRLTVQTIAGLPRDDSWDVLVAAREILAKVKVPLSDLEDEMNKEVKAQSDYLSATARKKIESANKRRLTARTRSDMMEVLAATDSLLRDVLLRLENASEPIVNEDVAEVVDALATTTSTTGVLAALKAVSQASDDLARNVTPQLALEVMLLGIKEALACPPSYR